MTNCWICESSATVEYRPSTLERMPSSADFKISDDRYGSTARLVECRDCGFRFSDPLPTEDLGGMYSELHDPEYERGQEGRRRALRGVVEAARRLAPEARTLLDIGAGMGLLCAEADGAGLQAVGVEPSRWAVARGREELGVELLQGIYPHEALAGRVFDIVTIVDVIEHLEDPVGMLREASAALAPGGVMAIVTPDVRSLAARLMGRRWWHYRVAHVGYFDRRTIARALDRAGLRVVATKFYVWYFTFGYVAKRLERYLPIRRLNGWLLRGGEGRLAGRTVPVNLLDSRVFLARKSAAAVGEVA